MRNNELRFGRLKKVMSCIFIRQQKADVIKELRDATRLRMIIVLLNNFKTNTATVKRQKLHPSLLPTTKYYSMFQ